MGRVRLVLLGISLKKLFGITGRALLAINT
jgi:hypothetical protein